MLERPFLFTRDGTPLLLGATPATTRVCQSADGGKDRIESVYVTCEQSPDQPLPTATGNEAWAAWVLPDGTEGRVRRFLTGDCLEQTVTSIYHPGQNVPQITSGIFAPFLGGFCNVPHQAPGRLIIRRPGLPTVEWSLVGVIRMVKPIYDDPTCLLLDTVEIRPDAVPKNVRGLLTRMPPNSGVPVQATYLLRTTDLALFRVDVGERHVVHASLLLDLGMAVATTCRISPDNGSNIELQNKILTRYELVPASPAWVPISRHSNGATRAEAAVTGARMAAPSNKVLQERAAIHAFFDLDIPCAFEGCEELRKRYLAELEEAGGENCPSCTRDSIQSKITYQVKEQLRKVAGPVNTAP